MQNVPPHFLQLAKKIRGELQAIRENLAKLLSVLENIGNHLQSLAVDYKSRQPNEDPPPKVPVELYLPAAIQSDQDSRNARAEVREIQHAKRDRSRLLVERVATFIALFLFLVALRQWNEMEKVTSATIAQTELLRQQIEGTQAAVVSMHVEVPSAKGLLFSLQNSGQVIASVTASITITRETLPDQKRIGPPISKIISAQPLKPTTPNGGALQETIAISGLEEGGWDAVNRLEETVTVVYDCAYENGFGKTIRTPATCKSLLFDTFVGRDGRIEAYNGRLIPCGEFRETLTRAGKARKKAEGELHPRPK